MGGLQHIVLPLSSPLWTLLQNLLLAALMLPRIDHEKQFFMWTKPLVELRMKMFQNWNRDSFLRCSEGLVAVMLALWCWCPHIQVINGVVPSSLHILETVSNHLQWVVRIKILSDLLEGWYKSADLRHCLNYIFSLLLKACCEVRETGDTVDSHW